MAEAEDLKNMLMSFRVSELQMLLGFAGRNKTGRKNELQARALELLRLRSTPVQMKIRELYKSIQQGHVTGGMGSMPNTASKDAPSNYNSNAMQRSSYPQGGYSSQTERTAAMQTRNMYAAPVYHQYQPKPSPPAPVLPVHPDVKLKKLPFYDLLGELLKPSSLLPQGTSKYQEATFVFHLTPQQASDIAGSRDLRPGTKVDYIIQVQMRFCLLETSCEQEDNFPPNVCVKVNGKMCPLPNPIPTNKPGVEAKRPSRPVNVTPLVKLSPTVANQINVTWGADFARGYAISVYLVRKLSSSELLHRLKSKGLRHSDFTRGLIKEKLNEDADSEIATTSLRVSLVCPLGKMRMTTPCRSTLCYHLQCFDASLYLQMNERKPTWLCPVCDKQAPYDKLVIDGYFQDVLMSGKLTDGNEIQLHCDGSWSSLIIKKEQSALRVPSPVTVKPEPQIETVSDEPEPVAVKEPEKKKKSVVIDLTGSSDSEDDTEIVQKKSVAPDSTHQVGSSATGGRTYSDTTSLSSTGSSTPSFNPGPNPVTSSGYISPSVITLDSPSPPSTPQPITTIVSQSPVSISPVNSNAVSPSLRLPHLSPAPPPPGSLNSVFPMTTAPTLTMQSAMNPPMYIPPLPPFLDLESDSNSSRSGSGMNSGFTRY